jgi:hypothetical protein
MNKSLLGILILFLLFTFKKESFSQINISNSGNYSQNFNSLLSTGSVNDFIDNSTIPSWYSQRTGTNISYAASDGGSLTGNLYSYGTTGSNERAIGSIGSNNTASGGNFAHGIQFHNTSNLPASHFTFSYTLEQWRKSNVTEPQTITFWYKKSTSPITLLNPGINSTWTSYTLLNATSPINDGLSATALNGNLAQNQVTLSNVLIEGLEVLPGEYIMFKWDDIDHPGADHGLAIDDVSISWLVLNPCITTSSLSITECSSYTLNGETYTNSGTYTQTLENANSQGCDSLITLNLTLNSTQNTLVLFGCEPISVNGETYTSSGIYNQTLQNSVGCDSLLTIDVTIGLTSSSTSYVESCGPYFWNGSLLDESGIYMATLQNEFGCDSIATLELIVFEISSSTQTISNCGPISINGQNYTNSGTYTQTLLSSNGCDSLVTYNITILDVPNAVATSVDEVTIAAAPANQSYQWINCLTNQTISGATSISYTATTNGSYAVIITNSSGCSDTSNCIIVTTLNTTEKKSDITFNLHPNPTKGKVTLSVPNQELVNVVVYNALGKIIYSNNNLGHGASLDLSSFQNGVYMIQIHHSKGSLVQRIVKN